MKSRKKLDLTQRITFVTLFVLLVARLFIDPVIKLVSHSRPPNYAGVPDWFRFSYIFLSFTLISIAIWINDGRLSEFNMDKTFVSLFIVAGIVISLYYLPIYLGALSGLITLALFTRFITNRFDFKTSKIDYFRIAPVFIIGLIPVAIFYVLRSSYPLNSGNVQPSISLAIYYASLPQVIFEEVVYRGLLWKFLKDQAINEKLIFCIQALLFWLSHLYYLSTPFLFWFWTLWLSLWLGLLVWQSKSITVTTVGHFVYNVLSVLVQY